MLVTKDSEAHLKNVDAFKNELIQKALAYSNLTENQLSESLEENLKTKENVTKFISDLNVKQM